MGQYKFEIFKALDHPGRAFAWIDLASRLFSHLIFDVTSYLRSEFDDLFMRKTYSSLMMSKYADINFTRENSGQISGGCSGESSGENSRENSGEGSGENSRENSGEGSRESSGKNPGVTSGTTSGEDSGGTSGKKSSLYVSLQFHNKSFELQSTHLVYKQNKNCL